MGGFAYGEGNKRVVSGEKGEVEAVGRMGGGGVPRHT